MNCTTASQLPIGGPTYGSNHYQVPRGIVGNGNSFSNQAPRSPLPTAQGYCSNEYHSDLIPDANHGSAQESSSFFASNPNSHLSSAMMDSCGQQLHPANGGGAGLYGHDLYNQAPRHDLILDPQTLESMLQNVTFEIVDDSCSAEKECKDSDIRDSVLGDMKKSLGYTEYQIKCRSGEILKDNHRRHKREERADKVDEQDNKKNRGGLHLLPVQPRLASGKAGSYQRKNSKNGDRYRQGDRGTQSRRQQKKTQDKKEDNWQDSLFDYSGIGSAFSHASEYDESKGLDYSTRDDDLSLFANHSISDIRETIWNGEKDRDYDYDSDSTKEYELLGKKARKLLQNTAERVDRGNKNSGRKLSMKDIYQGGKKY